MTKSIPNNEDTLATLRNTITLSVDLFQIQRVTCLKKSCHRIANMRTSIISEKSFYVLHHKPFRTNAFKQADVMA